jgi:hypothetical protein
LLVDIPLLEFPDGFAFGRKFDVGIGRMNARPGRVTHERHANFLQDASLHEAGIKGVAKIMEAHVTNGRLLEGRLPRALYDADRLAAEADDKTVWLTVVNQQL